MQNKVPIISAPAPTPLVGPITLQILAMPLLLPILLYFRSEVTISISFSMAGQYNSAMIDHLKVNHLKLIRDR